MSVVKAETDIITSIKVRQKGQHVILYAVTFTTYVLDSERTT